MFFTLCKFNFHRPLHGFHERTYVLNHSSARRIIYHTIPKELMAALSNPSHFFINTDLKSYKRHHKRALVDNPIYYWLKEGYAYLTPKLVPGQELLEKAEQANQKGYRDYLREMEKGSLIYAYESMTGAGYVAAGVVQEKWDKNVYAGRAELFMDEQEIYYRIRVEWDKKFSCSLIELQKAGFGARLPAIGPIKDEQLIAFLSSRRC